MKFSRAVPASAAVALREQWRAGTLGGGVFERTGLALEAVTNVLIGCAAMLESGGAVAQSAALAQLTAPPVIEAAPPRAMLLPAPQAPARAALFSGIVKDESWARILGKALFWDTAVAAPGSSCAGCHFAVGIDAKIPDQGASDIRMRRLATAAVAAGPGTVAHQQGARSLLDVCTRHVSIRPAEISDSGPIRPVISAASADPDSTCREDASALLARTVLQRRPLAARTIAPTDTTFGSSGPHGNLVSPSGRGLERTYLWMIQQAFVAALWEGPAQGAAGRVGSGVPDENGMVERNFSLFWAVAIKLYESSLDPAWTRSHGCPAARCDRPSATWPQLARDREGNG